MKILHLDKNHPLLIEQLRVAGHSNHEAYTISEETVQEIIGDYHGVVLRSRIKITREWIDKAVNLRFIARVGAGLESIDTEYARAKNIVLISAPEGNRNAVAEHALGMLLALLNRLPKAHQEIKQGRWSRESNRGEELDGKTVGIIGYGNTGKSFAKKLRGFNTEVLCYDILNQIADENAQQVSLEELQLKSDVLSLHVPLTPLTNKMINTEFINRFAKPFYFINTARGGCVVTDDLVKALQFGKIRGAGLDVLEYEKHSFETLFTDTMPDAMKKLLAMDNVIITPHIAGWTVESKEKLAQIIVDKINALNLEEMK